MDDEIRRKIIQLETEISRVKTEIYDLKLQREVELTKQTKKQGIDWHRVEAIFFSILVIGAAIALDIWIIFSDFLVF